MKCKVGREASSPQDAFPALPHLRSCTLLPCTLTLHLPAALVVFLSLQLKCKPHPHPSQAGSVFPFLIARTEQTNHFLHSRSSAASF